MLQILVTIMIILCIAVAAFYAFGIAIQSKDGAEKNLGGVEEEISGCRAARVALLGEVLRAFPQSRASTRDLEILMSIYPKADTEEREIAWEKKYISALKLYMQSSLAGLTGEPLEKWCDLNERIEANEAALTEARERKASLEDHVDMMGTGVTGALSAGGSKMKDAFRKFEASRLAREEQLQKGEDVQGD